MDGGQQSDLLLNMLMLHLCVLALVGVVIGVMYSQEEVNNHGAATGLFLTAVYATGVVIGGTVFSVGVAGVFYLFSNVIAGVLSPTAGVPFGFVVFCTLVLSELFLLFVGISMLKVRAKYTPITLGKPKLILFAMGKTLLVGLLSGFASHLGGLIGGIVVMVVLAGLASFFNVPGTGEPQSGLSD